MTNFLRNLFCSSLGKKYIMAITGCAMFMFVIGHMLGNLQIFIGPEAINRYGNFLQTNTELLWPVRLIMLTMVLLHIWSATSLTAENRAARPVPYGEWNPTTASYASRTMMMSGLIIAAFVIYHILHYTVMVQSINMTGRNFDAKPEFFDAQGRHDIYKMLVVGFNQPVVAIFYIIAMALLCLHLSHGVRAMFQSLGWKKRSYADLIHKFSTLAAAAIFLGYVSVPIAILLGYGKEALK